MFQFSSNSKTLTAIELMLRNRAVVTNTHWPSCMGNRVWLSRASGQTPSNWGAGATAGKAYGAWNTRGLWAAPGRKLNCRVSGSCQEGAPSFSLAYSLSSTLLHTFLCLLSVFISFCLLPDLSLCSLSHCFLLAAVLVFHPLLTTCSSWMLQSLANPGLVFPEARAP